MKVHSLRLNPNQDLKKELLNWAVAQNIEAACILTCVGSLKSANLRLANGKSASRFLGFFEIVSLVGTFSKEAGHFHISLASENGQVVGGHLLEENLIHTTAELVLLEITNAQFQRQIDSETGYQELVIVSKE